MRVITDLLPSVFAVTANYTFKNSHLRFNCNLAVSRNKILCNVFSTCYTHHTDLIIIVYGVFDWRISRAIFHFILFYFVFVGSNIRKCSYPNKYGSISGNYISNFSVFSSSICGSHNSEKLSVVGYSAYVWRNII